ncbi:hypothetical protein RhiJN_28014 [Ceratobasidium sp. AG-Ba]|nr:hypothetical protein RhiJN_13975 [Ceratobasidium sp. AG-Ba]QRV99995.1 hypothetical protein RhiJN_28014 [Ceratobasidium sp. AG-Ba]QRW14531.1 hypothetical protein RhiLY_13530 [Ceratobasidium sp. AG-Ba]
MSVGSSRDEIPRIALYNLDDWERIQREFTAAVDETRESTLADKEPISDEDKALLLKHLQKWQSTMFETAKANITMNGQDLENYVPEPEETEPFDELLVRRRQALTEEQLVWDKTLADRRRKAPREVERVMEDLLVRQSMAIPVPLPTEPVAPRETPDIPRWDEIVETHAQTAVLSTGLIEKLPTLASQTEKAKKVDQAVSALPSQ